MLENCLLENPSHPQHVTIGGRTQLGTLNWLPKASRGSKTWLPSWDGVWTSDLTAVPTVPHLQRQCTPPMSTSAGFPDTEDKQKQLKTPI